MRNILLAIALVALLPASVAVAEQAAGQKSDKRADKPLASKQLPIKGTANSNSCAAYGPGFVKIEGTETCMKVGGAVSIGGGVSSGRR
jgi:hypothetical protein